MNRKIISILIALAMLVALVPMALAANSESTGKIEFITDLDDGVFNPGDKEIPDPSNPGGTIPNPEFPLQPDGPGGPITEFLNDLSPMNLYFGQQEIDLVSKQEYPSVESDGTTPTTAGILVISHEAEWQVNVAITGFRIGGVETIKGFELDLTNIGGGMTLSGETKIDPVNVEGLTAGAGGSVGDATKIATGEQGIHGANYEGLLKVLPNTAQAGDAQADLYWYYVVA